MLSIEDVKNIGRKYMALAEDYDDDRILDVVIFAADALECYKLIDTEADRLTFGEFTRRYERAIKQLEELV